MNAKVFVRLESLIPGVGGGGGFSGGVGGGSGLSLESIKDSFLKS